MILHQLQGQIDFWLVLHNSTAAYRGTELPMLNIHLPAPASIWELHLNNNPD